MNLGAPLQTRKEACSSLDATLEWKEFELVQNFLPQANKGIFVIIIKLKRVDSLLQV